MCVRKSVGLALLAFFLIAGQSEVAGVTACSGLIAGISGTAEIDLENSFTCGDQIVIEAGYDITINGGGHAINFTADVTPSNALFHNLGTLKLNRLTVTPEGDGVYVRGVYNEGELSVVDSIFEGLNIGDEALEYGGAVSHFKESARLPKPSISPLRTTTIHKYRKLF